MRVLHFYKAYFPTSIGGVEQVINQLCRGSQNLGVTSEVVTLIATKEEENTIEIDGHLVHRCKSNFEIASTPFSISAFFKLYSLSKKADVIHYHFPYPFADLLHFLLRFKKPSLVTYHSDIIKQKYLLKLYRPLMLWFLKDVDQIVVTSPNYLRTSNILSLFKDKVNVIPIGLDKKTYPSAIPGRMNYWKKRLGEKFFLFIGVIRYYKGLHILVEAARNSEYKIVIVGAGPIEKSLKEQAKKIGVNNIHFVGRLSDSEKVAILELSYAVVFPSNLRSEAFGVSLLEGAMYGKPLISSEIGTGTSYINKNKITGLVVPPNNPAELRKAMDYLWNNKNEADEMGKNAQKRYQELFTAERMVKSYNEIYGQLKNISFEQKRK